jgi:tetratricopeptide (TPR) repeat protein
MRHHMFVVVYAACLAFIASAQSDQPSASVMQRRLVAAQARINRQPKSPEGYNDLAVAYLRWARDAGSPDMYVKAEAALKQSLQISPGNLDARRLQVSVLVGENQNERALKLAASLQDHNHDDISVWALLVDANLALGRTEEAERDGQWILDLRSGSSLGFTKAAQIREATGDSQGAVEFYDEALRRTSPSDLDERSWLLTQEGRLQLKLGNSARAQALTTQALQLFPDSHLAKALQAEIRAHQDSNR